MKTLPFPCPDAPDWGVPWIELTREYSWIEAMRGCSQDPVYHAEGDVWTHTRMVCEALVALDAWRALPEAERELLFAAALLHDQAKPSCTRMEAGRITSRGHSLRGAIDARRILWDLGADFALREEICTLIRYHQASFHLLERENPQRTVLLISQTARCELLGMLARADILGRTCADQELLLEQVSLFEEFSREQDCLTGPRRFASARSRFEYFRSETRQPDYRAHEEFRCEVTLMSGLPGAGKDTWVRRWVGNLPVVSLDAIRDEIGARPAGKQGPVVQLARERAREFLRQRQSFVWNATNLSRDMRGQLIDLFTDYQARVRVVYVEASAKHLARQNANREKVVPAAVIRAMMDRWEVPSVVEADGVEWWVDGEMVGWEKSANTEILTSSE